MIDVYIEKIRTTIEKLKDLIITEKINLDRFDVLETDYKKGKRPPCVNEGWDTLNYGETIGGYDKHFWLHKKMNLTMVEPNEEIYFDLKTGLEGKWDGINPQALVYIDGSAIQGLDLNHTEIKLDKLKQFDMHIYLYSGMKDRKFTFMPSIVKTNTNIKDLYYDMAVLYECIKSLDRECDEYVEIVKVLELTCNLIDFRIIGSDDFYKSVENAKSYIRREYYDRCSENDIITTCIGHTHIDVAWLWTVAQSEEKVQRSFATVMKLMSEYDDYKFMSSQPQLYKYVKDNELVLYEKIKQRIKEGRWEAEGAMWVEADCNLTSGESLVRQILLGKRFFKEEFGIDSKILWLPDVFGYSAAMPQILKKSGIEYFVTSKISWNETNKLPYDVFMWEGIDGSEIFTSFITAREYEFGQKDENYTTYVGDITPSFLKGTRRRFQQKKYSKRSMIAYGFGDGGGGPTRKMLEYFLRLKKGLPGYPTPKSEFISKYLKELKSDFEKNAEKLKRVPRWVGELYLEFHRGTYTSMARNKKFNRMSEFLMQTAEQISVLCETLGLNNYPTLKIKECWEKVLLNQFHDIITGSSIEEVYKDSDADYKKILSVGNEIINNNLKMISEQIDKNEGVVIYNPNSFFASGCVDIDGTTGFVEDVSPFGWKTFKDVKVSNSIVVSQTKIENKYYVILFDDKGNITSLFDKEYEREVCKSGSKLNVIEAFEDLPYQYDNWELSAYYKQKKWAVDDVTDITCISDGARAGLKITRKFLNSVFTQNIWVYDDCRNIDFETFIDWKESHIVLKAAFPVDIHSNKAVYETQFGYIERPTHENTSYDSAKFEVCAHKYIDISEDDYGVSIINNCKYGYNVEGNNLKITLLKCGTEPNKNADKEKHSFTYSLVPHYGNHKEGKIIQSAYLLNRNLLSVRATGNGNIPNEFSFVNCDKENIIIETLKKSEEGNGIVVRLYDAYDRKSIAKLHFGMKIKEAYLCDLMENVLEKLEIRDEHDVFVKVSNFEIATIIIKK